MMKMPKTFTHSMPMLEAQQLRKQLIHASRVATNPFEWPYHWNGGHVWARPLLHGMVIHATINARSMLTNVLAVDQNLPIVEHVRDRTRDEVVYISKSPRVDEHAWDTLEEYSCRTVCERDIWWTLDMRIWYKELDAI